MPIADFLATVGQGSRLGNVAQAFGGKTAGQQRVDEFINKELPVIAESIHKATTTQAIRQAYPELLKGWVRAGLPVGEEFKEFSKSLIGPAIENLQEGERQSLIRDYGAKSTPLTPQVAPPGQGEQLPIDTTFEPQTTPARNPMETNEGALRMLNAFGVTNPQQAMQILQGPGEAQTRQLSNQKTAQALQADQAKEAEILKLSDEPEEPSGLSKRGAARLGALTQMLPQRERPEDPLMGKREALLDAQINRANRGDREPRRRTGTRDLGDRVELIDLETGEVISSQPKGAAPGSETVTDQPMRQDDAEIALAAIAQEAVRLKKTSPEDLKAIAAKRGLTLEGNPTIENAGGLLGFGSRPTLTGNFEIKRKPKVTTKTPTGREGGTPQQQSKELDQATAAAILKEAGGNKDRARQIAKQRGFKF